MIPDLLIYTPQISPRLQYVLEICFKRVLSISYELTTKLQEWEQFQGARLAYGLAEKKGSAICLPAEGLLWESQLREELPIFYLDHSLPYAFQVAAVNTDWNFDFFSMAFYLLSRYEEYLPGEKDVYGRFPANQSLAYTYGFLERPLIDEWTLQLMELLKQRFPNLPIKRPKYQYTATYDIDIAWAFGKRPWYRNAASVSKDLLTGNQAKLKARWQQFTGKVVDPFYSFDYLDHLQEQYQFKSIYFFLLGDLAKLDRSIHPKHPDFIKLFKRIQQKYLTGIHPSFRSNHESGCLRKEMNRFQELAGQQANLSRQHYLYVQVPFTFRTLITNGILADYSLGYSLYPGYRASIARPFPWYDLLAEESTSLILHPFQLMDVTLKRCTNGNQTLAIKRAINLIDNCKKVSGHFYSLWHNSSFATHEGWTGWDQVYEKIIEEAIV